MPAGSLNVANTNARPLLPQHRRATSTAQVQTWTTARSRQCRAGQLPRERLDHDQARGRERRERHAPDLQLQRRRPARRHGGHLHAVRGREPRRARRPRARCRARSTCVTRTASRRPCSPCPGQCRHRDHHERLRVDRPGGEAAQLRPGTSTAPRRPARRGRRRPHAAGPGRDPHRRGEGFGRPARRHVDTQSICVPAPARESRVPTKTP